MTPNWTGTTAVLLPWTSLRDRAAVAWLWTSGCRRGEYPGLVGPEKSPDRLDHARCGMQRERESRRAVRALPEHGRGAAAQPRHRPPEKTNLAALPGVLWSRRGAQPGPGSAASPWRRFNHRLAPHRIPPLPSSRLSHPQRGHAGRDGVLLGLWGYFKRGARSCPWGAGPGSRDVSTHPARDGDLGRWKRTVPLRRKRLTRGSRKPSALRAWQRVKEHFPPPRSDRSRRPSRCQHLSPPAKPRRSSLAVRSSGKKGEWVRERRDGERSPLRAPHGAARRSPCRSSGKEQWGREPTAPAEGRAARRDPAPLSVLGRGGTGSAAAGPTANPVPPRGRRRAEGRSGGGRSPRTAPSRPHGGTLLAAAGSHPPSPARPITAAVAAESSRPPEPGSPLAPSVAIFPLYGLRSGARCGAEWRSRGRQALNPLPAGSDPAGSGGA